VPARLSSLRRRERAKLTRTQGRDVQSVLDRISDKYPNSPIFACAWSAGAYTLVRYLEKAGADTPLVAAVCQSGCLDFAQAVHDVYSKNVPTTYQPYLALQGRICVHRHLNNDKTLSKEQRDAVYRALGEELHPLRLYDRFLCAVRPPGSDPGRPDERHPLSHVGFVTATDASGASHYIARASTHLDKVETTLLLIHAEDDPVVTSEHMDWSRVESNRHIIVAHTMRGGHCSWYEGLAPFGTTWGDGVTLNFVSAVLETHAQTNFFVELVRQSNDALKKEMFASRAAQPRPLSSKAMARIVSVSDLASLQP